MARVGITDHSFALIDGDLLPIETADWSNGFLIHMSAGALVYTGIDRGDVNVEVDVRAAPPDELDVSAWEEVVEISLSAPRGDLHVCSLDDCFEDGSPQLPRLSSVGPGFYRVRAHCRGRDGAYDQVVHNSAEDYLLVVWPAPPSVHRVIKATDRCGASVRISSSRSSVQGRPTPPRSKDTEQELQVVTQAFSRLVGRFNG